MSWHWDACNLEERASRTKCNAEGGLEETESKPGKNPTEDLSDPYIDDFLASQQLNHGLSGLLMAITRTDNNNTVVYQVSALVMFFCGSFLPTSATSQQRCRRMWLVADLASPARPLPTRLAGADRRG